jgi:hypothetical protein
VLREQGTSFGFTPMLRSKTARPTSRSDNWPKERVGN